MSPFRRSVRGVALPLSAVALCILVSICGGCTEDQRKSLKHTQSGLIGLKRTVTLYDCSGEPIRTWEGRFKVEMQGGVASFLDDEGNEVKVSGTYVIEELD